MAFLRVLLPTLFGMVAAAPAAHVDVQVERPAPNEPGKTREETVSITFRAVDYRPACNDELRVEFDEVPAKVDAGGPPDAPEGADAPRPRPRLRGHAPLPPPAPVLSAAPRRADVRAGRLALPPPARRV